MRHVFINSARVSEGSGETPGFARTKQCQPFREQSPEFTNKNLRFESESNLICTGLELFWTKLVKCQTLEIFFFNPGPKKLTCIPIRSDQSSVILLNRKKKAEGQVGPGLNYHHASSSLHAPQFRLICWLFVMTRLNDRSMKLIQEFGKHLQPWQLMKSVFIVSVHRISNTSLITLFTEPQMSLIKDYINLIRSALHLNNT